MDNMKLLKIAGIAISGLGILLNFAGDAISQKQQKAEIKKAVAEFYSKQN